MNKRDFFIRAMAEGRFKDKRWLMAGFSIIQPKIDAMADMKPWDILYVDQNDATRQVTQNTRVVFIDDRGEMIELSDYDYDPNDPKPPYTFKERISISDEEMVNLKKKEIETSYGNVLANWLLCVHPFGDRIDYIEGRFGVKDVEKHIESLMDDFPDNGQGRDPSKIYVDEYFKYRQAASLIDGLTQLCVPSATAKSMTRHPDTVKVREELLEKYKDRLHDPATIAKIDAALGELDREWLAGDKSMDFYIKAKSLDVVRKKAHLMMGYESSFSAGGEGTLIRGALAEGWKAENLPELASSLREGSYDRGASTALGGEAVKFILRVMQNTVVSEDDCQSKNGMPVKITKPTQDQFVGNYLLDGGKLVQLTDENVGGYLNKDVIMRSPMFCRTERSNFCATCIGGRYGEHTTGLATAASNIGSIMMAVFMSSMHGKALKTAKYSYKTELT